MKIIAMKQLRQKFGPMRKALDRGEDFLLMYRSKPLAVIRPYSPETDSKYLDTSINTAGSTTDTKAPNLNKLPDPQTISFSSKFNPDANKPLKSVSQSKDSTSQLKTKASNKPLDKFGMKKAFI
ncbi:MAG: hypothetical protein ABII10_02635 [Candidatus Paceibacterota bacterium]